MHPIIHLGDDLVGVELGVFEAINFCFLLQSCPNIKTLYGADAYKPNEDFVYGGQVMDEAKIEFINMVAYRNIKFSGESHRANSHVMDTLQAADKFDDESLHFIFQDADLSYEQAMREIKARYPNLRQGGIDSGHDYNDPKIPRAVNEFRENERIGARMPIADDCSMWYKP